MENEQQFKNRIILVTGASGFIGSHLCARLLKLGAIVHGVSRQIRDDNGVTKWWQTDLDSESAVKELVNSISPDYIFHLASFVSGRRELEFVQPALRSNLLSTVNILIASTDSSCQRLVLTGSLEESEGNIETTIPASPYAAAKSAASLYAQMFYKLYATPVVTARLFMVYGPDQPDQKKLVPYVILSLLRKQVPNLMSGMREVDWIYVDDVVDAYLALASKDGIEGATVDVGSGELVSVRSVVDQITNVIQPEIDPVFGGVVDRPMERIRIADIRRSKEVTGWMPKTSLTQGLQLTVDWYSELIN